MSLYFFIRIVTHPNFFFRKPIFRDPGSRENVKIRDTFLQHLSTPESIVPSPATSGSFSENPTTQYGILDSTLRDVT